MYVVQVYIHIKLSQIDSFIKVSTVNADMSRRSEPGVIRFDIIQQADDPTRFVFIEVYRSQDAAARHKETAHYNQWREIAEQMMAEPRTRLVYVNISPTDSEYT
jgi:(4S)-4-hydroxy-5-phosphonooxypentane-2,3-dione isomerase